MLRTFCLCLALLSPLPALSEPLSFSGSLSLGTTDLKSDVGIGAIDATLTIPLLPKLGLGFEIGTYLFALEGKRPHETYAGLVLNDRWRLGVVRPAFDAVLPSVFTRAAPFLAYRRAEYTRAHATVEAMRNTAVPWGVSWQNGSDQTDVRISLHGAVKGKFRTLAASVVQHRADWTFAAAIEPVWLRDGSYVGTNIKVGSRREIGTVDIGAALLLPGGNDTPDAFSLDMKMPMSNKLDMHLFGEVTEAATDDAYGVALDYQIGSDSSVIFSLTDGALGQALHLTLDRRF